VEEVGRCGWGRGEGEVGDAEREKRSIGGGGERGGGKEWGEGGGRRVDRRGRE